jgi:hypothetical protein
MNLNFRAAAAAIVVGASALTCGVGQSSAAPLDSPPSAPVFHLDPGGPPPGIPAEKCWRYGRVGPGSALNGGGVPGYLPQCPSTAKIEGR